MSTQLQVLSKTPQAPINALSLVERYGDKVHLIAPATDRFSVSSDLMVPYATQIIINPNPQAGDVHDIEGKLVLSAVSLSRLSTAAGIVWSERQTRPLTVTKDYICYRAVGYLRLPCGSSIPLIGTKEIDMDAIAAESRIKKCKKLFGARAYDSLTEEERRQVDNAVNIEMATFRKHRLARAETGAKTRAIRSLGVRSSYGAAELARPFTVVRWGVNPSHEYAQAERAALWGELSGQMPVNPLPAHEDLHDELGEAEETEVEVLSESEEMEGDVLALEREMGAGEENPEFLALCQQVREMESEVYPAAAIDHARRKYLADKVDDRRWEPADQPLLLAYLAHMNGKLDEQHQDA